jgi:UDP-GlcNAc:undecaprenyl-phosphate GlcNAc-1-phosphate transferase
VRPYLLVFAASAGVTFVVTPFVRRLSLRLGWIDQPSDRKVHPRPTPTAGGLAMYLGVAAGLLAARAIPFLSALRETSSELDAAFVAATVVVVLGMVDDTRGVSAIGKLAGQVLAAGIVVLLGVQLLYFYFPGRDVLSLSPDLAVPLTVLWIVALMNAVNLVDGLDGLAAGMVAIAAIAFFAYFRTPDGGDQAVAALRDQASVAALMSTIVAGVALGFLPWNFHPARIFMGDSGALLLGLLMAVATISGVGQNLEGPSGGDLAAIAIPIVIPLLVLAVPLLDVVLAIVRRMRKGIGIAHADKQHIHHRLMDIGHSHRQAVLLMYLWSALIAGAALAAAYVDGRVLVTVILVSGILVATVLPRLIRDRAPRGSDRPAAGRSGRRAGRHRPGAATNGGRTAEPPVGAATEASAPAAHDGVPLRSKSTPALSDEPATSRTRDTA